VGDLAPHTANRVLNERRAGQAHISPSNQLRRHYAAAPSVKPRTNRKTADLVVRRLARAGRARDHRCWVHAGAADGTITLLFADIERSTALLREAGPERYGAAISDFRRIMRGVIAAQSGAEVDTEGDAFFSVFPSVRQALTAAVKAQAALSQTELRVRMGLHTGEPLIVNDYYSGIDVHRAARIAAAGHGGQVLLSQSTRELLEPSVVVRDLVVWLVSFLTLGRGCCCRQVMLRAGSA
jgi:class 3 adenylate cyclase